MACSIRAGRTNAVFSDISFDEIKSVLSNWTDSPSWKDVDNSIGQLQSVDMASALGRLSREKVNDEAAILGSRLANLVNTVLQWDGVSALN
jgi:hypothetical protein